MFPHVRTTSLPGCLHNDTITTQQQKRTYSPNTLHAFQSGFIERSMLKFKLVSTCPLSVLRRGGDREPADWTVKQSSDSFQSLNSLCFRRQMSRDLFCTKTVFEVSNIIVLQGSKNVLKLFCTAITTSLCLYFLGKLAMEPQSAAPSITKTKQHPLSPVFGLTLSTGTHSLY